MNLNRWTLAAPALLLVTAFAPDDDQAQSSSRLVADAGKIFKSQCMGCHDQPDLDFAVDRAWLGQVKDTA